MKPARRCGWPLRKIDTLRVPLAAAIAAVPPALCRQSCDDTQMRCTADRFTAAEDAVHTRGAGEEGRLVVQALVAADAVGAHGIVLRCVLLGTCFGGKIAPCRWHGNPNRMALCSEPLVRAIRSSVDPAACSCSHPASERAPAGAAPSRRDGGAPPPGHSMRLCRLRRRLQDALSRN